RKELLERGAEAPGTLRARGDLVGSLGWHVLAHVEDLLGLGPLAYPPGATLIDGDVTHQAKKPRPRAPACRVEAIGTAPDPEEGLLHRILGGVRIARD